MPVFLFASEGDVVLDTSDSQDQTTIYISESNSVYGLEKVSNAKVVYEKDLRVAAKPVSEKPQYTKKEKRKRSLENTKEEPQKDKQKKVDLHYSQNTSDKFFLFKKVNLTASVTSSSNFLKFLNSPVYFYTKKISSKNKNILFSRDEIFIFDYKSSVFIVRPPPVLFI